MRQRAFDQAVSILTSEPAQVLPWANLGDWSQTEDYQVACRQLAQRLGQLAKLGPGTHLLDLAFGHGASLAVWLDDYKVSCVDGIELEPQRVQQAKAALASHQALGDLLALDIDQLSRIRPSPSQAYDAVVCVDAAYHLRNLDQMFLVCASLLKPGGSFVLSTLIHSPHPAPLWHSSLARLLLKLAGISANSQLAQSELPGRLEQQGFQSPFVMYLDQEVLGGFAAHVGRLRKVRSWRQRLSLGWLSLEATRLLCQALLWSGQWHYVVIQTHKRS